MSRNVVVGLCTAVLCLCLVFTSAPRSLSSGESRTTVGGVCIDDFVCSVVATCDTYNFPTAPACPHPAGCLTCDFATTNVKNCVASAGNRCDSHGGGQTECGQERVGFCPTQSVCSNTTWFGTDCDDGPDCDSKCP